MPLKVIVFLILVCVHLEAASKEFTEQPNFNDSEFSDLQLQNITKKLHKDWEDYLSPNASEKSKEGRTLDLVLLVKKIKLLKLLKVAIILELYQAYNFFHNMNRESTTRGNTNVTSTTTETPEEGIMCSLDNDLIIAVDSSGSVGSHYSTELNFTAEIAASWRKNSGNRVSVFIYSDFVEQIFDLEESRKMTEEEIRSAILGAPFHNGATEMIHLAVEAATNEFIMHRRRAGNQREVPKNFMLLTDGYYDVALTETAAEKFYNVPRTRGFAVGIGKYVHDEELFVIAKTEDRLIKVDGFNDLSLIAEPISKAICEV